MSLNEEYSDYELALAIRTEYDRLPEIKKYFATVTDGTGVFFIDDDGYIAFEKTRVAMERIVMKGSTNSKFLAEHFKALPVLQVNAVNWDVQ